MLLNQKKGKRLGSNSFGVTRQDELLQSLSKTERRAYSSYVSIKIKQLLLNLPKREKSACSRYGPIKRQTERQAVESPHDREARLFQGPLRDLERGRQRYSFCFKRQTDRTPGRRKSSRQRGLSFQRRLRDGEGVRAHYLSVATFFWSSFTSYVCASCLTQPNIMSTP